MEHPQSSSRAAREHRSDTPAASTVFTILSIRRLRLTWLGAFAFLLIGLLIAGAEGFYQLNTEGIVYLQMARYFAGGDFAKAISGYWSPLFSGLAGVFIGLGFSEFAAARISMGISALGFWAGALCVLGGFRLSVSHFLTGAWLTAAVAIPWSLLTTGPELLLAGVLCLGISLLISDRYPNDQRIQAAAGAILALGAYAKLAWLPLALGGLFGFTTLRCAAAPRQSRLNLLKASGIALAVMTVLLLPWLTVLGAKGGIREMTCAWWIPHAVSGPRDIDRYHPSFRGFARPESGRITTWEEPARLPYHTWSPLEKPDYFRHQIRVAARGVRSGFATLLTFGWLGLPWLVLLGALIPLPWHPETLRQRWRWSAIGITAPILTLAPLLGGGQSDVRLLYPAYPFVIIASFGAVLWFLRQWPSLKIPPHLLIFVVVTLLASPVFKPLAAALEGSIVGVDTLAGDTAVRLAQRMKAAGIRGSIAGSAMIFGNRTGLYTAFLLRQPWLGDLAKPTIEGYRHSKADLIIVNRASQITATMAYNLDFRNLDNRLFATPKEAKEFPLQVFARGAF